MCACETLSQLLQPPVEVVTRVRQRLAEPLTDLTQRSPFEEIHVECGALPLGKVLEARMQPLAGDEVDQLILETVRFLNILRERQICTAVVLPPGEVRASIERSTVGDLNNPRAAGALRRIEATDLLEEADENLLHQVFGLAPVVENLQPDAKEQIRVAIEQNGQGCCIV